VIASRTAIDLLRKKKNWNTKIDYQTEIESDYLPAAYQESLVELTVQHNFSNRILVKGIEELSPDARQLLYMRYILELKLEEIANEIGVPIGTVKGRLFRIHQKLSKILTEKYQLRGEDAL
jgi:RNA polymerase sigma factor (sigma-70 family)